MITRELKLKLTKAQEAKLNDWLWILTGVHNWALRKIELDAKDGRYYSKLRFKSMLPGHSKKIGIPTSIIEGQLVVAHMAWQRCFTKITKKPRLKGLRNKLSSIPIARVLTGPKGNKMGLPGMGQVRFHKQSLPSGKIKQGRIIKRANGWYLCLFIDAQPNSIPITGNDEIGIDPGFTSLLTLSTGEKIEHPRELEASAKRLAQAQRGKNKSLTARIQQRIANQRKDRNHKLSRRLVSENAKIVFSADNHRAIAKKFGKSVASSGHGELRRMLSYKSSHCGRTYIEVNARFSTMTCSDCRSRSGPTGLSGLAVRFWVCSNCGSSHDRDVNAAINTLRVGAGLALERNRKVTSEIIFT